MHARVPRYAPSTVRWSDRCSGGCHNMNTQWFRTVPTRGHRSDQIRPCCHSPLNAALPLPLSTRGSELRVVELLDEICKSISTKYSPVKINRTEGDGMFTRWVKVSTRARRHGTGTGLVQGCLQLLPASPQPGARRQQRCSRMRKQAAGGGGCWHERCLAGAAQPGLKAPLPVRQR